MLLIGFTVQIMEPSKVKKAFYKASLIIHPDKVSSARKPSVQHARKPVVDVTKCFALDDIAVSLPPSFKAPLRPEPSRVNFRVPLLLAPVPRQTILRSGQGDIHQGFAGI